MNILEIIILSIVEGVTEFLPVSSTAHLLLVERLLGLSSSGFLISFTIVIQFGAILAVVALFGKQLLQDKTLILKTLVGFLPTAVAGFTVYRIVKEVLLTNLILIPIALIAGGILFILLDKEKVELDTGREEISYREAFYLGLYQIMALIPGVSRSGSVIIGGLLMKIKRTTVVYYTFWLALPTMAAASAYELLKSGAAFSQNEWQTMVLGFCLSFLVSLISIKWLVNYVKNHTFAVFGWYRIVLGILILVALPFF